MLHGSDARIAADMLHPSPVSCTLLSPPLAACQYVQTSSRHPLLAALHPLALIDLLSFAPSLVGVLVPEYTAPGGWDLRWFRVFR